MTVHQVVLATKNHGKIVELRALLGDRLGVEIMAMSDVLRKELVIVEDGATFAENALKKARAVAAATMMLTIADDSGLEVDALGGAPGVRSARFAGDRATDAENNAALIAALDALEIDADGIRRARAGGYKARFRCVLAMIDPYTSGGEPRLVDGACEGAITTAARGSGGFGYDPLFLVDGTTHTMAELDDATKNRVSHRARAVAALSDVLAGALAERDALTRRVTG